MQRLLLRHILLILLSLSLPVTGLASVIVPSDCAMHTAHAGIHGIDSCCHQDSDQRKSSDLCKSGYTCPATGMIWFSAASASPLPYVPRSAATPTQPPLQFASNALAAVWRPPQH